MVGHGSGEECEEGEKGEEVCRSHRDRVQIKDREIHACWGVFWRSGNVLVTS